MKSNLLSLLFLAICSVISAQDTIFVKSGEIIPAVIIEKNKTEIKYKKFGQTSSKAVYSVLISDVASIHFKDGIIADYNQAGKTSGLIPKRPVDYAGTMKVIKLSLGFEGQYFSRSMNDRLLEFWRFWTTKSSATIGGNPVSIPVVLKMGFVLGSSGRNWLGDELQLIYMPKGAIHATEFNNAWDISLGNFYYNITLFYGHTINHKKTAALIIEPGFDIANMFGTMVFNADSYKISGAIGMGYHVGLGFDTEIGKRITFSGRVGYRSLTIKEQHEQVANSYYFYTTDANSGRLTVGWKGVYVSAGLNYNFYVRMKGVKLE